MTRGTHRGAGILLSAALALLSAGFHPFAGPRGPHHSVLARYDVAGPPADRWELPKALAEISGLAVDARGRVFAHDDERAIVYQLDLPSRRIVKRFAFGQPAVRGDFEAIAVVDGRFVLTTSDGLLYSGPEGQDGEAVPFVKYATGAGALCEVEGLAYDAGDRSFLLACKAPRVRALRGYLAVLRWSVAGRTLDASPRFLVPLASIASAVGAQFHPSELARDPAGGHLLVLAAREHAIAELAPDGKVVDVVRLRHERHRQPEGLAFDADGSLLVSDEANGGRATLTRYRAAR